MHEFAEEYVAKLKPRDERYDTRLGDDFYVATFPNGVKTWSYVFEVNGFTRRQTLGVYPEMPLPQALEALYAARRTRAVESELAEQGLDGTQVRKAEDSPVNLTAKIRVPKFKLPGTDRRFLIGTFTGGLISFGAALALWVFLSPVLKSGDPAPVADVKPLRLPAAEEAQVTAAPARATPPSEKQEQPATQARKPQSLAAGKVSAERSKDEPEQLSDSQIALRQLQKDMAGTLAWAQLTSEVRDGEPVDQLEWVVEIDHEPKRVFYFVRVRGMAGATVTYRWRHEGKLLKEDAVQVGKGWHSPAYSGMTLTAERLGRWQVEVYGPDGQALGSEEFEARMTSKSQQLSQR